jgi:[protein-PII] uridylyltransferase
MSPRASLELPSLEDPPDAAGVAQSIRNHLERMRAGLAKLHAGDVTGSEVNRIHAKAMDQLLVTLASRSQARSERAVPGRVAVAAVGGYGRRELSIHSDVDLLILHDPGTEAWVAGEVERLQRWLWDAGLKLGLATRTVDDTLAMAAEDQTICTAVLDARLIAGDPALVGELEERLLQALRAAPEAFARRQMQGMEERQAQFGESLYLLQPNLKEGAGGLRDYHAAWWASRVVHPGVKTLSDLEGAQRMTGPELESYIAALDFLWKLRNQLHLMTGRATDQMTFDLQERVADDLGYEDPDAVELPVERFMGAYYRHARVIQNFSNLLLELAVRTARGTPLEPVRNVEEGFRVADDHLEIPDGAHLRQQPLRLLQAFVVAQEHDVALSREARRHIRENLDLAREELRADPQAGSCLDRILACDHRVMRTLVAMNETGLLGAWIPEWEHIVCRWQQVTYHTYTVDVHSIFVVEELRRLWQGKYATGLPALTELIQGVRDRSVLFLGCLFHDIGKGLGGDHSIKGVDLTRALLDRVGFSAGRRDRVLFLVQHHLLMSHLAQRRDLSDPKLIVEFARTVGDRANLRNLYLLTFADIRASSRSAWSEWKGQLLQELFERTSEFLETGGDRIQVAVEQMEARVEARQAVTRRELQALGVADDRISAYFAEMPRRYFIAHSGAQITRHAMAMLAFRPEQVVTTQVRSMRGDFSELIVITRDVHGLYAKVAGVITAKWINILGSHVYTTRSGMALEIYRLGTPSGGPTELREVWRGLQMSLHGVLSGVVHVRELLERRGRPLGVQDAPTPGPVQVEISNDESDFYTIVDVTANDRIGLLYDLTQTIAEHGLETYVSKAATILDQVADTFYLKDAEGRKVQDTALLERLRAALLLAATGPEVAVGP